ncbi:LysE family translocator [Streptomyces sp. NPDC002054]|uniref:LysE family translocator n=1 Tax=Streptomyces sp. NPDC002054 TaxID=3154663 RepID=UPI003317FD7C
MSVHPYVHPYAVAGFLAAVFPLIATPGASLALLVQRVGEGGRRQAWPVVLGTVTGLYVHAALAVAGLSALVMHSARAFTAVRIAGACWLIGLGLWTWYAARRAGTSPGAPGRGRGGGGSGFLQALLANVLNPKAASVYLTLVPQFIEPGRPLPAQVLVLATAHALLIALWLLGWTVLVRRASGVLRRPGFRAALSRVTAVVLIGLGIRTAVAA